VTGDTCRGGGIFVGESREREEKDEKARRERMNFVHMGTSTLSIFSFLKISKPQIFMF
jgi:hypothetical protein